MICQTNEVIMENIQLLDPAPQGTGEWVTVAMPKWRYNWVETFAPYIGGLEIHYAYTQPDRYETNIVMDCDFVNPRWYLPADAHPKFDVGLTVSGTHGTEGMVGYFSGHVQLYIFLSHHDRERPSHPVHIQQHRPGRP